ncbi:hypothetical protein [Tomitella gaofuii]|uniref:hypothetical protein n=1 Tax=Tomitella gaofuii TaxID=2760083 RepID=UPI0015F86C6A|nr:hypothetical protein [Tomitella gaofuii]
MRFNFRPYYLVGALSTVFMIVFITFAATGESGTEYTWSFDGESSTESYSTYNVPAMVIFGILGFGGFALTGWMKRHDFDWPKSWQKALSGLRMSPSRAAGMRSLAARVMFAGPLPAQELHGALLHAIAPDPKSGPTPRVYLLESVPGHVAVAFGQSGQPPLWTADLRITASGEGHASAVMVAEPAASSIPGNRGGIVGGEVLDAMFDHVESIVPQRNPLVAVNRVATVPQPM